MKKIIFIILGCIMGVSAIAQDTEALELLKSIEGKWKKDGSNVYVQDVFEFEGKTKEQLYILLKEHLINLYKDANSVIQLDDKESGIIVGKGTYSGIKCTEMVAGSTINHTFWHIIKGEVKDNRIRITITLTKYDEHVPASQYTRAAINEYSVSNLYPINTTVGKPKWGSMMSETKIKTRDCYLFYKAISSALLSLNSVKLHIKNSEIDTRTDDNW